MRCSRVTLVEKVAQQPSRNLAGRGWDSSSLGSRGFETGARLLNHGEGLLRGSWETRSRFRDGRRAPSSTNGEGLLARVSWETRSSREVYANDWIRVIEDETVRPDGSDGIFGVVEVRQPAVFVVAVTGADEVVLITIDRYTTGTGVEVPAGSSDEGEHPEQTARRELLEETGYAAESLTRLGRHWANNGVARAEVVVFLARGLSVHAPQDQELEGITGVAAYPWRDVRRMLRDGTITDSESVGALMLAAIELGWA